MTLTEVVPLVLKASIMLMILALGLTARPADLLYMLKRPRQLWRSLLSMYGVMLLLALLVSRLFQLGHTVTVVVVALALAPIPPLLPKKQTRAGGDASHAVGLVVAASLFAVFWIPLSIQLLQLVFGVSLLTAEAQVMTLVFINLLSPLIVGALIHQRWPLLAEQYAPLLAKAGGLVMLLVVLPILYMLWRPMLAQVQDGAFLVLALFILCGLFAGQLLGGPEPEDRTVLALATASRHPGVSIAIAHLNFPNDPAVLPVIGLYLILTLVLVPPWLKWRRRRIAQG
ncbi:BASS family bile acid:Na+ symporter [Silvimonas terrae]|uniref:BASS family bile acid:Na+ symporter n=1 Tax=Silvimonas terrae TaxID=300266 RepID=A0A840RCP0_9NEIS|nr:bile acid:sodium symporter [Silvimonas terrae]MBB5190143.1 BASS family bile acid:Na+ symporter [Silvimonas terrae]